jgi:hypothetical protein
MQARKVRIYSSTSKARARGLIEQAGIISDLLESGYTMEQAEVQFALSVDRDDCAAIRTQLEAKKSP